MPNFTWGTPGNSTIFGENSDVLVRINNTVRKSFKRVQDALLRDHQDERVVDGGRADSIQFHLLLGQPPMTMASEMSKFEEGDDGVYYFDCNEGVTGTADWIFDNRRDFEDVFIVPE
jgi:hypothetical protein